jgi:hypothetical protein
MHWLGLVKFDHELRTTSQGEQAGNAGKIGSIGANSFLVVGSVTRLG